MEEKPKRSILQGLFILAVIGIAVTVAIHYLR